MSRVLLRSINRVPIRFSPVHLLGSWASFADGVNPMPYTLSLVPSPMTFPVFCRASLNWGMANFLASDVFRMAFAASFQPVGLFTALPIYIMSTGSSVHRILLATSTCPALTALPCCNICSILLTACHPSQNDRDVGCLDGRIYL